MTFWWCYLTPELLSRIRVHSQRRLPGSASTHIWQERNLVLMRFLEYDINRPCIFTNPRESGKISAMAYIVNAGRSLSVSGLPITLRNTLFTAITRAWVRILQALACNGSPGTRDREGRRYRPAIQGSRRRVAKIRRFTVNCLRVKGRGSKKSRNSFSKTYWTADLRNRTGFGLWKCAFFRAALPKTQIGR